MQKNAKVYVVSEGGTMGPMNSYLRFLATGSHGRDCFLSLSPILFFSCLFSFFHRSLLSRFRFLSLFLFPQSIDGYDLITP